MKTLIKSATLFIALVSILLVVLFKDGQEILIESSESKTIQGTEVFNKIKFIPGLKKDIWMMNQSHHGVHAQDKEWDRLAIVVDKNATPETVSFYQIESGSLDWSPDLPKKRIANKVACFMCHSNGPRAIRPNYDSKAASLSVIEKMKIGLWNMRIKTYGRLKLNEQHNQELVKVPVRYKSHYENAPLKIASCTKCHKEDGILSRGNLTRQNSITIKFMVENGHMPPPGFEITKKDKESLDKFLRGF